MENEGTALSPEELRLEASENEKKSADERILRTQMEIRREHFIKLDEMSRLYMGQVPCYIQWARDHLAKTTTTTSTKTSPKHN